MKKSLFISFFILLYSLVSFAQVEVSVKLSPAGSFKAKSSEVVGSASKTPDGGVAAKDIQVAVKNLKTGIKLRDEHTIKHLEADKHPHAILVSAMGKGGKFTGVVKIKGIEKPVMGTYKTSGTNLLAEFPIKLSDYAITGIKYMGVGVKDEVGITVKVPLK